MLVATSPPDELEHQPSMNKRIAAGILTAAIASGGAAGILLTDAANAANAADGTTSTTTAPAAGATAPTPPTAADRTPRRTAELTKTLQGLVDSGKITAEQRDAVIQAIVAAQPGGDKGGPAGPGGFGGGRGGARGGGVFGIGPEVAKALGIDAASLRTALEGGKSIADVAKEKGIAVDTVVQAVVAAETARIDQAVTDGKLSQAQADARKADLTARVAAMVNEFDGTMPAGMPGGHGPRGQRPAGSAPAGSAPSGSSFNPSGQASTTA
jgi:polyhydroxyalkanoate synthesis regulator phasin